MRTRSSPLPFLPLEVKHDILRFCDPATLAKMAQVSLAFLELSSPILYEDVHIQGFDALKLLFSERTQSPSLQTAPFLSLSQIRDLSILYSLQDIEQTVQSGLFPDRTPLYSPLDVQKLKIFIANPFPSAAPSLELLYLGTILNPRHLVVQTSRNRDASVLLDFSIFFSLETIHLVSVRVGEECLGRTARRLGWPLLRVTFDLPGRDDVYFEDIMESMLEDLPLPEPAKVVVLVENEGDKGEVLARLAADVEERDPETRKEVLAQVKVEVRERT